jgi:hypothetical protein
MNPWWLFAPVLCVACEPGYANLAEPLDPLVPFTKAATSFVLPSRDGTEVLTLELPGTSRTGRIAFLELARDGATHMREGAYAVVDGELVTSFSTDYRRGNESSRSPMSRIGSETTQLNPPRLWDAVVRVRDDPLEVTIDDISGKRVLLPLDSAVDLLADSSRIDPTLVLRACYLQVYSSQVRVPGFGGAGMTEYLDHDGEFGGLLTGTQTVRMEGLLSPVNTFTFTDYSDLAGWTLDGRFSSSTNTAGDGSMAGELDARLTTSSHQLRVVLSYGDVELSGGTDSGGTYGVTVNGTRSEVDYAVLKDLDLRGLVP